MLQLRLLASVSMGLLIPFDPPGSAAGETQTSPAIINRNEIVSFLYMGQREP